MSADQVREKFRENTALAGGFEALEGLVLSLEELDDVRGLLAHKVAA
jgi:hypothetical protein